MKLSSVCLAFLAPAMLNCSFDASGYSLDANSGNTPVPPPMDGARQHDASGRPEDGSGRPEDAGLASEDATSLPDAPQPDAQPQPFAIRYVGTPPIIDGVLDDAWNDAASEQFTVQTAGTQWDIAANYAYDAKVKLSALHDDNYLYLLAEVHDTQLMDNGTNLTEGDGLWFFLDATGALQGNYQSGDHVMFASVQNVAVEANVTQADPDMSLAVKKQNGVGYVVEISFSLTRTTDHIGLNIGLVDNDELGGNTPGAKAMWKFPNENLCPQCCNGTSTPWCDRARLVSVPVEW